MSSIDQTSLFEIYTCRLSASLVDTLRERAAEDEKFGYNEFVEHALRVALRKLGYAASVSEEVRLRRTALLLLDGRFDHKDAERE